MSNSTIECVTLTVSGFDIRIEMVADTDSSPIGEDWADPADIEAWRNDEWFYAGFVYTAMREGVELGTASIWGTAINLGDKPTESIADWIAEDYYHPDLITEAITEAQATLTRLGATS